MQRRLGWWVVGFGVLAGCTERVNVCNSDSDCTDPAYPFCDVAGEYAESGHTVMSCSITPDGCPIERCGCIAGLADCTGDQLTACNAEGTAVVVETCPFGCAVDGEYCSSFAPSFVPSNGLATQLAAADGLTDIAVPDGATIDTDAGSITGLTMPFETVLIAQPASTNLRVFVARSWAISNARIVGSLPVAFVASRDITIHGTLDASADGPTPGPGGLICEGTGAGGSPGVGFYERPRAGASAGYPEFIWAQGGFGGGGYATAGGNGGTSTSSTGAIGGPANGEPTLEPLRGGCQGSAPQTAYRGAGGGGVQLVGGVRIRVAATGVVHVGGGGAMGGDLNAANAPAGGGSGGAILIESPLIELLAGARLNAAGGGGGGYGACPISPSGMDSPPALVVAVGGACNTMTKPSASGGDGATTLGGGNGADTTFGGCGGGGGGGLGRVRLNSRDGGFGGAGTIRGVLSTGSLKTQ